MRIHGLLSEASDLDLEGASACPGWTVLDVGRHVESTPRTVVANLTAHVRGAEAPTTTPLPMSAARSEVLNSLSHGAEVLDVALAELDDTDLDSLLPGPVGPMVGRTALDLALTELTLHRCDIELGLSLAPQMDDDVAERVIDVVQAWLLLTAQPELAPEGPACFALVGDLRTWWFAFDGTSWSADSCDGDRVTALEGDPATLALALAGRASPGQEPTDHGGVMARLKAFLPGP